MGRKGEEDKNKKGKEGGRERGEKFFEESQAF